MITASATIYAICATAAAVVMLLLWLSTRHEVANAKKQERERRDNARKLKAEVDAFVKSSQELRAANPRPFRFPPADLPVANDGWYAMPCGTRLEYKASGFTITLNPANAKAPYALVSPEGEVLCTTNVLMPLKMTAKQLAAEREEFAPNGGAA